jgi:hypothetical protein
MRREMTVSCDQVTVLNAEKLKYHGFQIAKTFENESLAHPVTIQEMKT